MKAINLELTPNEISALFAAVNYVEQQIYEKRVHTYVTILDWETLYPQLVEKLDKLRAKVD